MTWHAGSAALAYDAQIAAAGITTVFDSFRLGRANMMGAPNVVRGGSHSDNASACELAEQGELDILSSDYVPGALLMAAFRLAET